MASVLYITEQGVRNRLVALEVRQRVEINRKQRGPRRVHPLTEQGQRFLPHAIAILERAHQLAEVFHASNEPNEIGVAATQYLILYVLIDAVRCFDVAYPQLRVRRSNRTEQEIETDLLHDPEVALA
ncbi:MAG TPA: hypothetical protein VH682_09695 [Gemmataceae bacterium]